MEPWGIPEKGRGKESDPTNASTKVSANASVNQLWVDALAL